MLVVLVLGAVLQRFACGQLLPCNCGESPYALKNRIVGGSDTQPNEFPWTVAIFQPNGQIYCGSSIISDRHILTAGHCVMYTDAMSLYTVVGMHNRIRQDGVRYNISRVLLHPDFEALRDYDVVDVAVLEVDRPIRFSDYVRPVCLPLSVDETFAGRKATVAGWGRMWTAGRNSENLQATKVRIQSDEECRGTVMGPILAPGKMMCAYAAKADACQGDSGGPLILETQFNRFQQLGVVSFGSGCGTPDSPGIYVPTTYALPWLRQVIRSAGVCNDVANK